MRQRQQQRQTHQQGHRHGKWRLGATRRRIVAGALAAVVAQVGVLIVLTASPASAVECGPGEWAGDYFGGVELAGTPVDSRCDSAIDFDWTATGPEIGGLGLEAYSVRWTYEGTFTEGGYEFVATADDGV
nr:hypothetical protein [Micromonospora sp. DSM 115978]